MSVKPATLQVFRAFDRVKFGEVPTDDDRALEDKIEAAISSDEIFGRNR